MSRICAAAGGLRWLLALILLLSACGLCAQALEVQESAGFVEALLPSLGWRQAVVGRQIPAGSVATSWLDARARIEYRGSTLTLGPLTHLRVDTLEETLVRLSLSAGSLSVDTAGPVYEVAFRGMTIRIEKGAATLSDAVLTVTAGMALLMGARDAPLSVPAGTALSLLSRRTGPVFSETVR